MGGAARRALKKLVDHISGSTTSGRPPASHRELYDLRVQRIGFGSFELSYAAPQQGLFDRELLATAVQKLDAIVRWAASSEESPAPWYDEAEREAMLRAAAELAPPSSGPIVAIELGGDWLRRGMVRLDRSARKNVRMELRNSPTAETVESVSGRIGEVDRDALSLTLRDLEKGEELRASFDEELLDDVLLFFTEDQRVRVAGTRVAGKLHVGLIAAEMRASSAEGEGSL
jgi:hypothetical protein